MSTNEHFSALLSHLAAGIDLLGKGSFRASGHRRAARLIRRLELDLADIVNNHPEDAQKRLEQIEGIGKGTAKRIVEFVTTGGLVEHQQMLEEVPRSLIELLEVPGLGPAAVRTLWKEMGIESIADLKRQLDADPDALASLPRLGKASVEKIRKAVDFRTKTSGRIQLGRALPFGEELRDQLRDVVGVEEVELAGSLRRGRDAIGDIDLLACGTNDDALRSAFRELPGLVDLLSDGESKLSARFDAPGGGGVQVDLRIVPRESWGAALMYFTGSQDHNIAMRGRASRRGMLLNEYGLFERLTTAEGNDDETPSGKAEAGELVVGDSEEAIFRALHLEPIPPELREEAHGLEPAPLDLVTLEDIDAELHSHTTESDGRLELEELARHAIELGLHTLAVTDHSQSSALAGGLEPDRLRRHVESIRELDQRTPELQLLAGSEVDILPDGSLDYEDDLLAELDIVVASPHAALDQPPEEATQRLLSAIRHPLVHIVGHPTGRIVGRRRGLEPDMAKLVEAAAECNTILEINANPRRLDLRDTHARAALAAGCKLAINTDAHSTRHFTLLRYGVVTARRAGLSRRDCINTWSAQELREWLERKRAS